MIKREINMTKDDKIACLKCHESKYIKSFVKKDSTDPSIVCFSCWKKFQIKDIINDVSIKTNSGCLLWPDKDRTNDYYNTIRRKLSKKHEKCIHVRCNHNCLNVDHFFYFNSNSAPYWFKYGLNSNINFENPSGKELLSIKDILYEKVFEDKDCWVVGNSSKKKSNIRIGDAYFSKKKIYYEVFVSKIKTEYFSISSSCGNINCVSPKHMILFDGRSFPYWARKNLKMPEPGMGYCQSDICDKYSVQISQNLLKKYNKKVLCNTCFNTMSAFLKKKKSEYDIIYSENNRQKIKTRYTLWSKTHSAKLSQIISSQNRRDKSLRKVDKKFLSKLIEKYNSCCYCGRDEYEIANHPCGTSKFHLEHVVPILCKKEIGTNNTDNLELACWECNLMKKNKYPRDWLSVILKRIMLSPESEKIELYKKISATLSEEKNYKDNKFIPRHMRN
jgi:5-methylcytosine-specific restriction endonuclease McrA